VLDGFSDPHSYYTTTQTGCSDCANLATALFRVLRGGCWDHDASILRATNRYADYAIIHSWAFGWRCSRTP
jgi:formylglycine-generating enzyme required for sulfatase activity